MTSATPTPIGCTSTAHDRTNCDKAFSNSEIDEDEICPSCRARMVAGSATPACDRPGCFDEPMVPVKGLEGELWECPRCSGMSEATPTGDDDD